MKNKIFRYFLWILFTFSLIFVGYTVYSNYIVPSPSKTGEKIPQNQIKKQEYKSFDKYDFINLESYNLTQYKVDNGDLVFDYQGPKNLTFSLVDVYSNNEILKIKAKNNTIKIKGSNFSKLNSRYDLLTKENGVIKKLNLGEFETKIDQNFAIINNKGLELSYNRVFVDYDKEFKIFFEDLNYYRQSINLKPLSLDEKISQLSKTRTNDEVQNKEYNFHYTKTTGYSNVALINANILTSSCGKNLDLELNKLCDVKYKNKDFNINPHNNDFEQITRGLMFAHENLEALKDSPIHNRDLISENKTHIGGNFSGTKNSLLLKKENVIIYGPKEDHTDTQGQSAYINNDFNSGIKNPKDQEQDKIKFINVAFSIFLI